MTKEEHFEISRKYHAECIEAIHKFQETHDFKFYDEYKLLYKLSNKHFGIYRAMDTKEMKKKYGDLIY